MSEMTARTLGTIEKAFFIIEQIRETGGAGVTELARRTDLHKSTVHSHLRTLVQCGYLVKEDDVYRLSLRFLAHGGRVRNDMEIYQEGVSVIRDLASESGELANLGVEENGKLVVIFMTEGENAVHDRAPAGKYTDMHSTAMGKAILAHLPRERTERIIERHGLPARTENTITDRAALSSELEQIREDGFAIDDQEGHTGISCIAAPVLHDDGTPIGGVSVTGPTRKLEDDEYRHSITQQILKGANVIEVNIMYS